VEGLKAAFLASDNEVAPVFAVVTMAASDVCPVLCEQLASVVQRALHGLPMVLMYRDDRSEWRTFGDPQIVFDALKLDFDALGWVDLPPLSRH
jgi:hypothetical protein